MKKLKLFLAAALMLCSAGAWAQTDVTSTYLTNADFESDDAVAVHLCGYKADASKAENQYNGTNALYWAQPVTGWTSNEAADNRAAGIFAYGSDQQLRGNKQSAPATNPQGQATGKALGLFAVWTGTIQYTHEITLQAGKYSIIFTYYNQSGTTNVTNLFGFETESKNYYGSTKSFSTGSWKEETVTFTLTAETKGKVSIGYTAPNSGSGANPMLFIDCVKIEYTDPNAAAHAAALEAAKFTLNGYIKKATALNGVLADATLTTAISTAQGVYDAADDWADDYDNTVNASTTLNTAITTALSGTTSVALNNGNFDTTPNNTLNGDNTTNFGGTLSTATSNPDNTKEMTANTGDHGYLYDVTGWTQYSKFNSTASQGTTSEYGTAMPANGWSTNGTTPPATDMFGSSTGAALHLSAGWGDQARYQQTIENLSSGRYIFYYEVINQHNNTGIASNYTGVSGAAGDFYGTTNGFVFSTLNSAAQGEWIAQAFEFDVAKTANISFNVGFTTSTSGSANGAKLWVDNVLVYRIGDVVVSDADATTILSSVNALDGKAYNATDKTALASAKTTFEGNKTLDNYNALNTALVAAQASVAVYETLDAAIAKVESWTSDAQTVTDPMRTKYNNGEYANATTAADIYTEYQAAETAALVASDATVFTSVIINPSFETGDMTGWSAESRSDTGVKDQSNGTYSITSGDAVDGLKLFNSWGGSAENNVYQTIPNLPAGTYQLSALLAGFKGESLVLAANENTNSVVVAGDKTVGYTVNVVFTLSAATDVVIKASNTKSQSGSDASFIKADKFTLKAYSDPLAPLKEQLATLQAEANDLLANSSYANVTGTEQSTLSTLATTTPDETETAYNTAISEITAAIPAFKNAKPSYDAYVEANGIATTLGATAVTAPTTAAEAVTRTHELYVNIDTKVASDYPYNATDLYAGAFTGFTATNKGQHWSDNAETSYLDQWGTGTITATQNITLPAGSYVLKAAGRAAAGEAAKAYMSANGTTVNFANNGDTGYGITKAGLVKYDAADDTYCNNNNGCGWEWRFIPLTLNDETTVTINLTLERTASWGSFCDFTILMSADDLAGSDDYAALNAAIAAAEAKILGFDDTEYAPYNNVDALTKLAEAKAINQNVDNPKAVVTTATSDLTSATWTANDGDVEIIYNGMFATVAEGQNYPKGWTRTNAWGQMQTITGEALETAYYNQPGSLQYGNQGVYTMPLKANTAYQLSFSFRSHENGSNQGVTVSVLNSKEQGMAPALFLANGSTTDWAPAVAYFTTGDAGNYVLTLANGGNTWMTDVSLMPFSVAQIDFIEDDGPWWGADRQYMETVTIERTVKGGFNTVCLPFEVTAAGVASAFGENAKVYTFQDVDQGSNNSQINFNTKADNIIPANTPVLIGDATASTSQTFSAVMFRNRDNYTVTGTNFDFIGTYDGSTAILSGDYFIGNGALYKSAGNTTIKAFRAYLKAKSAGVKATLFIDGLETSIEAIENGQLTMDNEVIYNVAGQRLQKAQRGVNIINGKKVLVK